MDATSFTESSVDLTIQIEDVYSMAEAINSELEVIIKRCGISSVTSLVKKTVAALEALESMVLHNQRQSDEMIQIKQLITTQEKGRLQRANEKKIIESDLIEIEENYKQEIDELNRSIEHLTKENTKLQKRTLDCQDFERQCIHDENECTSRDDLRRTSLQQLESIRQLQNDVLNYSYDLENLQNNLVKLISQNKSILKKNGELQRQLQLLLLERDELLGRCEQAEKENQLWKGLVVNSRVINGNGLNYQHRCNQYPEGEPKMLESYPIPQSESQISDQATKDIEELVYGPINREPDEKTHQTVQFNLNKRHGVRRLFQKFKDLSLL